MKYYTINFKKNTIVIDNPADGSTETKQFTTNELKDQINMLIKGVYTQGRYRKAKNIAMVDFVGANTTYKGVKCPRANSNVREFLNAFVSVPNSFDVCFDGEQLTPALMKRLCEESTLFMDTRNNDEDLAELIKLCGSDKTLWNMLWTHGDGRTPAERIIEFCSNYISESGYDVEMSSEVLTESTLIYNFTDNSGHHEGIKDVTKKYSKVVTSALDYVKMYLNCKWYADNGLEPERTRQRRETIGLANSFRFEYADEDLLEQFIDSEMVNPKAVDYDEYIESINTGRASLNMKFY